MSALKNKWLREPLVQFLLGGLAIFFISLVGGNDADPASRSIVITEPQVSRLATKFTQIWKRPPTEQELDDLIRDHVKEEVYYREAKRMGLDIDDPIIRRRLRQKMEFLVQSEAEEIRPDDATLQAWLDRNPTRYAGETLYSFDQVFVDKAETGKSQQRARALLNRLSNGEDWREIGDAISLPVSAEQARRSAIVRDFGTQFADALPELESGKWTGPIASGFGLHLVRVRAVTEPEKPRLGDVRQKVLEDWRTQSASGREAEGYQALLDKYSVKIEMP